MSPHQTGSSGGLRLKKIAAAILAGGTLASAAVSAGEPIKSQRGPVPKGGAGQVAVLTNGNGDGSLTVTTDSYGTFGSATGGSEPIYDPVGPGAAAGTVFESSLYFSPGGGFLSTDGMGGGPALPSVAVTQVDSTTARSTFTVAEFIINLTQKLGPIGPKGSTLTQTYRITNDSGATQSVVLVRHVDGDLDFDGSIADAAGASQDGGTLYEFDSGQDPLNPTTFVGIQLDGSAPGDFTIQPYNFADDIRVAGGIPADKKGKIQGDTNLDRITDNVYDVTLSLQKTLTLGAGESATVITRTIFGEGSIDEVANPDFTGCVKVGADPAVNARVLVKQTGERNQIQRTGSDGCFSFGSLVSGKRFTATISGPLVD